MKTKLRNMLEPLRAAYQPRVPDLDVDAIMGAVRREAAAHPLRRLAPSPVAAIPTWACAVAASLAILAATSVFIRSINIADDYITHAWLSSIQPDELEQELLRFDGSTL